MNSNRKRKTLTFIFLFCVIGTTDAQTKYGMRKIRAFYQMWMPGNIPVDDNGRPLQHGPRYTTTIYIETTSNNVSWDSAWINGKLCSVTSTHITALPYELGLTRSGNKKIILTASPGNQLWQLDLNPLPESFNSGPLQRPDKILLRGKYGKKIFKITTPKPVELKTPDAV